MKQSCGKCKYYRVWYRSRICNDVFAICTWKTTVCNVPTAIRKNNSPPTTAKSGSTCKFFIEKEVKQ